MDGAPASSGGGLKARAGACPDRDLRRSKLRDAGDDADINRCGDWGREALERMDARFIDAMQRAVVERVGPAAEPIKLKR